MLHSDGREWAGQGLRRRWEKGVTIKTDSPSVQETPRNPSGFSLPYFLLTRTKKQSREGRNERKVRHRKLERKRGERVTREGKNVSVFYIL